MGGQRRSEGMSPRQLELAHRTKLGEHGSTVANLMAAEQDKMVAWGWCKQEDFRHLNKWHLMSAELVIAGLLSEINNLAKIDRKV